MNFQNEIARSRAFFKAYAIDEQSQDKLNMLASMVRQKIGCDWGLVTLIAHDQHVTQAVAGDGEGGITPREISFCNETIKDDGPFVVENTDKSLKFRDNVYTQDPYNVRFYAGVPIKTPDNFRVGALAVCGTEPHEMTDDELSYMKDLARLVELELESVYMSSTDELTGLVNRRAFYSVGAKMMKYAYSLEKDVTTFFFDLDKFKYINDTYGHEMGDDALKTFSNILRGTYRFIDNMFRPADLICRYGGDEFTALCINMPEKDVEGIIKRMEVAATKVCVDKPYDIQFSVGVSTSKKATLEEMIKDTDKRMYEMKFEGKHER